ncbi:cytochrome c [Cupriavidus sp. SW-Y-13]|uniref:c-type cytochrome n=1 Tax=Cupriavidus sp. SW-Y-13 TaxID=2653854 RepID=UPI0013658054|nr:cytochrome c [Cupriavidus sp. SW-Y-13]MWL91578.1 c-type cytochrome [Cupriavidus sp. SW-Y-13]
MTSWLTRVAAAFACAAACLATPTQAADTSATLTITAGTQQKTLTRDALLKDPRLVSVAVDDDNYKRHMTFKAIPMAALLAGLPTSADGSATTAATDGYVSHLPLALLLADQPNGPRAWLAVENPARPWPKLKGQDIGPYRLIWTVPKASSQTVRITESLWTWAIARIDVGATAAERFAVIHPAEGEPADGPVMRGFAAFQRVCFSCHSMNRAGDAHLGPDLNVPHNPVEYLGDERLAALVRNPQSLHWWPGSKMPSIDEKTLSDTELKDLLAYLHHMAGRKAPAETPAAPKP